MVLTIGTFGFEYPTGTADALAVHGSSAEFLTDKSLFAAIADEFLSAARGAQCGEPRHCLSNAELNCAAQPPIATKRVIDTLVLARRKHPGRHNTLDDLCARYGVDRSCRTQHGVDAELLAAVYVGADHDAPSDAAA